MSGEGSSILLGGAGGPEMLGYLVNAPFVIGVKGFESSIRRWAHTRFRLTPSSLFACPNGTIVQPGEHCLRMAEIGVRFPVAPLIGWSRGRSSSGRASGLHPEEAGSTPADSTAAAQAEEARRLPGMQETASAILAGSSG